MRNQRTVRFVLAMFVIGTAVACGDDDDQDVVEDADTGADADADADADPDVPMDADADADGGTEIPNEWGFDMRFPTTGVLDCTGLGGDVSYDDADWICSFSYDGAAAVVYVRSTPARCVPMGMSVVPEFDSDGQAVVGGAAMPVTEAFYDWGGNHHNDALEFEFGGRHYRVFHSSIGWGFRVCQPMDCVQVSDTGGTLLEDGCTCDRTIPAVCVEVQTDGTWDELVDDFAVCEGDPTCG